MLSVSAIFVALAWSTPRLMIPAASDSAPTTRGSTDLRPSNSKLLGDLTRSRQRSAERLVEQGWSSSACEIPLMDLTRVQGRGVGRAHGANNSGVSKAVIRRTVSTFADGFSTR